MTLSHPVSLFPAVSCMLLVLPPASVCAFLFIFFSFLLFFSPFSLGIYALSTKILDDTSSSLLILFFPLLAVCRLCCLFGAVPTLQECADAYCTAVVPGTTGVRRPSIFILWEYICVCFFAPRLAAPPGVWCRAGDAWSAGTRHGTLRRCRRVWEALSVLLLFYFVLIGLLDALFAFGAVAGLSFFHLVFSSEWFCTLCFFLFLRGVVYAGF